MEKENGTKTVVPALRFPEFRECESWDKKNIDSILDCDSSQLVLSKLNFVNDGYPVYGADGITGYIPNYNKDQVYISIVKDGSGVGRLNICSAYSSLLGTLNYLVSKNEQKYKIRWIYYLLQTIDFSNYIKGSGIPHIYFNDYKKQNIYISSPLEQQKIADCLSSLDDLIEATNLKIEALKEHKKGLMQRLFPKDGENVPELRFPDFQGTEEWEEKHLGNVGEIITGSTPSTKDTTNYGGDKLFVSPADISSNRYISDTKIRLSNKGFSIGRYIQANSVLFVCIGSTIGKVAQNKVECITNQQINAIVPYEEHLSDFIYSILEYKASKIAALAGKQAVPIINKSLFSSISILIPLKKDEQQKIADCLSSLDELIEATSRKVEILKEHKKGLMQQLFPKI